MCFVDQQHNRCENAYLLARSYRNDGAITEAGAREPAIRFRGNDTPSALIRRPGEGKGRVVPKKGEWERGRGNTFPRPKMRASKMQKAWGIIGAYHDRAVAYKS